MLLNLVSCNFSELNKSTSGEFEEGELINGKFDSSSIRKDDVKARPLVAYTNRKVPPDSLAWIIQTKGAASQVIAVSPPELISPDEFVSVLFGGFSKKFTCTAVY